jgi:hypothetical protein
MEWNALWMGQSLTTPDWEHGHLFMSPSTPRPHAASGMDSAAAAAAAAASSHCLSSNKSEEEE